MIESRRRFQTRQCTVDGCGLAFPVDAGSSLGAACPRCGAPTAYVSDPYVTDPVARHGGGGTSPGLHLEALLDNIRSVRNVGSIFRTADGAGVAHLHLGGITPTPEHPRMAKTALGAQERVPWTRGPDAAAVAGDLAARGVRLWALEGGPRSRSLFEVAARPPPTDTPVCLVLGHEVSGVDPRIVALCDAVVHLPMLGIKDSLNVSVAFGIAAYVLRFGS
jgi:tRNA G18 (ribose-2'-O)-methylase SpoU